MVAKFACVLSFTTLSSGAFLSSRSLHYLWSLRLQSPIGWISFRMSPFQRHFLSWPTRLRRIHLSVSRWIYTVLFLPRSSGVSWSRSRLVHLFPAEFIVNSFSVSAATLVCSNPSSLGCHYLPENPCRSSDCLPPRCSALIKRNDKASCSAVRLSSLQIISTSTPAPSSHSHLPFNDTP
jgi:hypothetical protein